MAVTAFSAAQRALAALRLIPRRSNSDAMRADGDHGRAVPLKSGTWPVRHSLSSDATNPGTTPCFLLPSAQYAARPVTVDKVCEEEYDAAVAALGLDDARRIAQLRRDMWIRMRAEWPEWVTVGLIDLGSGFVAGVALSLAGLLYVLALLGGS